MPNPGVYTKDRNTHVVMPSEYYDIRTIGPGVMTIRSGLRRVRHAFAAFSEHLGDEPAAITCEIDSTSPSIVYVMTSPPVVKNACVHLVGDP